MQQKVENAIQMAVDTLPCLQEMMQDPYIYRGYVYGGFPRYIAECVLSGKFPDVREYLKNGDVDIKIKSYNVYRVITRIRDIVYKAGGSIEYLGTDYEMDACGVTFGECKEPARDGCCYYGVYGIWFPWRDLIIRYDLFISKSAAVGYDLDYSVNDLSLHWCYGSEKKPFPTVLASLAYEELDKVLNDIKNKTIVSKRGDWMDYLGVKKIWRISKLWKRGFRVPDSEKEDIKYKISRAEQYIREEKELPFIPDGFFDRPSVVRKNNTEIPITKHKFIKLTVEKWEEDLAEIFKEIGYTN